jgi:hypothetical protein
MRFGTTGTSKLWVAIPLSLLMGALLGNACGSSPVGSVIERMIKWDEPSKAWELRAHKEKDDLPLEYCKTGDCRMFLGSDVDKIEKYIASLEIENKDLQKNCHK